MDIGIVKPISIEEEMKGAYLDYAMSVITSRALPDVRDGLKPVQRRILYAMDELGLRHNTPYKKSARIVGEVLGKYHPHGDSPVYEAMVRLAQDFSMRYTLVDGQGNFGSVDGDPPAAMRYTEARLDRVAEEMLIDIDKDTVDFVPNFDGSLKEPSVLPARLPNLLVNGAAGIAVGMATNIPPHNLSEVVDATSLIIGRLAEALEAGMPFQILWSRLQQMPLDLQLLAATLKELPPALADRVLEEARKDASHPTEEQKLDALVRVLDDMVAVSPGDLMEIVKGPDFPTAGIIIGEEGIKNAYATGHGRIIIRAKAHLEDIRGGKSRIVVTELPFQVNKAALIEKIAELVRDRRIEGISELRDESDRQGMRVVIELKRDAQAQQILNQLYKYTSMQNTFSINMLALVDGQPRVLTLKMLLMQHIKYRREVITRRTEFELARARHRAHILEGLKIALDNLDEVIATIRRSPNADAARTTLMKKFKLSEIQAQAILDMQLRRLAALERQKILDEYAEVLKLIAHLEELLAKPALILYLIRDDLMELKQKYGDARRTRILADATAEFTEEDLIPDQEVSVALTAKGYIKRMTAEAYRVRRNAKGTNGVGVNEDDAVQQVLIANMLDTLAIFSNRGQLFQIRVRDLIDATRQARGVPISTLIQLGDGESVVSMVPVRDFSASAYFVLVTRGGDIKRISSADCSSVRSSGLKVMSVAEGDELGWGMLTTGSSEVFIATERGQAIRFAESEVRPSGRASGGIRAIRLAADDRVVGASPVQPQSSGVVADVVVVSQLGFAKATALDGYPVQGRAGGGVRATTISARTGPLVAVHVVEQGDTLVLASSQGLVWKFAGDEIPRMSRSAQGSPLVSLEKGDAIVAVSRVNGRPTNGNGNGHTPPSALGGGDDKSAKRPPNKPEQDGKTSPKRATRKTRSDNAESGERAETEKSAKNADKPVPAKPQEETAAAVKKSSTTSEVRRAKRQNPASAGKTEVSESAAVVTTETGASAKVTVSRVATTKVASTADVKGTAAKPDSVSTTKRRQRQAEAITPGMTPMQSWLPMDDVRREPQSRTMGGQRMKATSKAHEDKANEERKPSRSTRSGSSKTESKSLVGSIAAKLGGKTDTSGPKRPRR